MFASRPVSLHREARCPSIFSVRLTFELLLLSQRSLSLVCVYSVLSAQTYSKWRWEDTINTWTSNQTAPVFSEAIITGTRVSTCPARIKTKHFNTSDDSTRLNLPHVCCISGSLPAVCMCEGVAPNIVFSGYAHTTHQF